MHNKPIAYHRCLQCDLFIDRDAPRAVLLYHPREDEYFTFCSLNCVIEFNKPIKVKGWRTRLKNFFQKNK